MAIDASLMAQLQALVPREIAPIKWQSDDPGERMLEGICALIGVEYRPPPKPSPDI